MKEQILKDYQTYIKIMDGQKPKNVLLTRTATPQGFANLIKELCELVDIKCEIVEGFYKM